MILDNSELCSPIQCVTNAQNIQLMSRRYSYMMSKIGTGQIEIVYPHLNFHPAAFFALGSPIGKNLLVFLETFLE